MNIEIRDLCIDFRDEFYSKSSSKPLNVLPYNRFDSDRTDNWWWLVPAPENPAFKYGKFLFYSFDDVNVYISLHIEKGLSEAYKIKKTKYYNSAMDRSWQWNKLVRDFKSGEVYNSLEETLKLTEKSPLIHITSNNFFTPSTKYISYKYNGASKIELFDSIYENNWKKLNKFNSVEQLFDGVITETNLKEDEYFDFRIGCLYKIEEYQKTWNLTSVYDTLLSPLERWVK